MDMEFVNVAKDYAAKEDGIAEAAANRDVAQRRIKELREEQAFGADELRKFVWEMRPRFVFCISPDRCVIVEYVNANMRPRIRIAPIEGVPEEPSGCWLKPPP